MRALELTDGRTDATRLLVANRVQRRAKTVRAARSTQVEVRTYVTLTTVQFVGSADLAAWEQSLEPRLLVHVVREDPAVTVVDAPVGTETLTIDGARVNLLPASAVNVLRTQTWEWIDGVGTGTGRSALSMMIMASCSSAGWGSCERPSCRGFSSLSISTPTFRGGGAGSRSCRLGARTSELTPHHRVGSVAMTSTLV